MASSSRGLEAQLEQLLDDPAEDAALPAWTQGFERTWHVEEDESGQLRRRHRFEEQRQRREQALGADAGQGGDDDDDDGGGNYVVEKNTIRYLYVVVDCSTAMEDTDVRPSRRRVAMREIATFANEFFDQNPISQLGFITMSGRAAAKVTELSGSPAQQLEDLRAHVADVTAADEAEEEVRAGVSLDHALRFAHESLAAVPVYASREVLVVMGSNGTCDASDIYETIDRLVELDVRVSVVSLSASLHVCRQLAQRTGGVYGVALDAPHFRQLLHDHVAPRPVPKNKNKKKKKQQRKWVRMGFPPKRVDRVVSPCVCHVRQKKFSSGGYHCPKCASRHCELPTTCRTCGLSLLSSPLLARSYHHLFPVPHFEDVGSGDGKLQEQDDEGGDGGVECFACREWLEAGEDLRLKCKACKHVFCVDCDIYIHEALHNCPGCCG